MIRAVLLDAHGTLVTLEPPAPALQNRLRGRFGVEVTLEQAEDAIAAEIAYYRAHLGEGSDEARVADLRGRCAEVLRRALPPSDALAAVGRQAMTSLLLESLTFRAYPDAAPALRALRAAGVRLVVASNWDASLQDTLSSVGLARLLDGVVSSAAYGAAKPDPRLFEAALAIAGAGPHEALHVGDRIDEDVAGARAAGVEPVLIVRDGRSGRALHSAPGPVFPITIASLTELPQLLADRLAPLR